LAPRPTKKRKKRKEKKKKEKRKRKKREILDSIDRRQSPSKIKKRATKRNRKGNCC
jgi:hypothetical protein